MKLFIYNDSKFYLSFLPYMWSWNGLFNDLADWRNHEFKEMDRMNFVRSSVKSLPLWVSLYLTAAAELVSESVFSCSSQSRIMLLKVCMFVCTSNHNDQGTLLTDLSQILIRKLGRTTGMFLAWFKIFIIWVYCREN